MLRKIANENNWKIIWIKSIFSQSHWFSYTQFSARRSKLYMDRLKKKVENYFIGIIFILIQKNISFFNKLKFSILRILFVTFVLIGERKIFLPFHVEFKKKSLCEFLHDKIFVPRSSWEKYLNVLVLKERYFTITTLPAPFAIKP